MIGGNAVLPIFDNGSCELYQSSYPDGSTAKRLALLRQQARATGGEYEARKMTTGWQPSCSCDREDTIPCLVLDCFAGSGTVCVVAQKLGRRAVGLDLSGAYLKLAAKRLEPLSLPLAENRRPL